MNIYEKYKYIEGTDADGWSYRILKSSEDLKKEAEEAEKPENDIFLGIFGDIVKR